MPLTPEDVANKQFTSTRLKPGYDETEVDEFLDEVEAELTRLYRENDELRSKVAAAGRGAPDTAPAAVPTQAPAAVDPNPALARENDELRQKLAATQRQLPRRPTAAGAGPAGRRPPAGSAAPSRRRPRRPPASWRWPSGPPTSTSPRPAPRRTGSSARPGPGPSSSSARPTTSTGR